MAGHGAGRPALLYRRVARTADLAAWDISRLLADLAAGGDRAVVDEFLARDPGRSLPADDSLLATPAMLDRPAAALLARRIVDAGPRHPAATIRSLCAAGLTDLVREMMTPDPDDLIAVLEVLHEKGFDDEARHLAGPGWPRPKRSWEAAAMICLFDALGIEDALTSVVEAVNTDERLRRRQWWSADDLDNMPTRVRDRLRLDAAPSPSVTPTPETTSPS